MKKPSDHLFKVIKSLTKSEKRAFSTNASIHKGQTKYLAIFEAINAQIIYDEEAIKQKFKNEKWVNRFSVAKEYVYKALLAQLSAYSQRHETDYQLGNLIIQIRVLQQKGFYPRCAKLIKKGKQLAKNNNEHLKLLELLNLESINHPGGINPTNATSIEKERKHVFELLNNENDFEYLYKQSYAIFSKTGYAGFDAADKLVYDQLMKSPLLQKIASARTFNAKRRFVNIHYFYASGSRLVNEMERWVLKAVELFEETPLFIKKQPVNYATTLLNLHDCFLSQNRFDEALETLDKLNTFFPANKRKEQDRLAYIIEYGGLHNRVATYNRMGRFDLSVMHIQQLNDYLDKHDQEMSKSIYVRHHYLVAISYFGANKFKECGKSLAVLLNDKSLRFRSDLIKRSRILQFLVYFELEKYDLLAYNVRSVKRFMERTGKLNAIEQSLFRLVNHLLDHFADKLQVEKDLEAIEKHRAKTMCTPDYTEISDWVKSKLIRQTYAEFIRSQLQFAVKVH